MEFMDANATLGDGNMEKIVEMCETMRAATVHLRAADPIHGSALLMTATAIFGGTLAGHLIVGGLIDGTRADQRRLAKMFEKNFIEGLKVGLKQGARHAQQLGMVQ